MKQISQIKVVIEFQCRNAKQIVIYKFLERNYCLNFMRSIFKPIYQRNSES